MTTMTTHAVVEGGRLKVDVPTTLPAGEVQIQIIVQDEASSPRRRSFKDIVGKLSYKGDPMALQKEMRDEWPD